MILSIAAIMLGMLERAEDARTSGIGNDVIARPGTTSNLMGVSGAPASTKVQSVLEKLPHVQVAAPVYIQLVAGASLENIYGINYRQLQRAAPVCVSLREGRSPDPATSSSTTLQPPAARAFTWATP